MCPSMRLIGASVRDVNTHRREPAGWSWIRLVFKLNLHLFSIVKNRESRLAILIAHVLMIPTYFYLMPYLQLIPTSVFHGLFLYMAFSSMIGNELCERLLLIFTEQVGGLRRPQFFFIILNLLENVLHVYYENLRRVTYSKKLKFILIKI